MIPLFHFGASIFPATAGADLVSAITTAISDNIGVVLVVVGAVVGINWARRALNRGVKGKV